MTYILEPLNEGQDMNARVKFKGTKSGAIERARLIAYKLATVLDGCSITCRVAPPGKTAFEYADLDNAFLVMPNGRVIT